ncbi:hypothetical protein [Micromonospora okii]|uniref:hypothetical protein n=1 Tax=Micromonospora okii TaxID=1182970 RepID=UPI001E4250F6|nr:hypothetical protein [Micromonospora okii]
MTVSDFNGVQVSDTLDRDGEARFEVDGEWRWLRRSDVRELRDHLSRLLGDTPATAPAAVELVEGREYRLLPDSRYADGGRTVLTEEGATRVRLTRATPDDDGDVFVKPLDGSAGHIAHAHRYVDPKYLAPLDDASPAPAPDAVRAAREVAEESRTAHHYITARWWDAFADKLEGKAP